MDECARVLVDGGVMALNVGDIHNFKGKTGKNEFSQIQLVGHRYQAILRRHKVYLTDLITWVKSNGAFSQDVSRAWSDKTEHTNYRILIGQDPVYIFRKAGKREQPSSEKIVLRSRLTKEEWSRWANGIWNIPRVRAMDGHPVMYPDELVNRLVKMFSYEGDTVLDPFLGSGTTFKVAQDLGRVPIGYERELQYKSVIMGKLEKSRQEAMEGWGRLAGGKKEIPEPPAEPKALAFRREENTAFPDMMSKAMGKSLSDKLCKPAQVAKESSDQPEEQRI